MIWRECVEEGAVQRVITPRSACPHSSPSLLLQFLPSFPPSLLPFLPQSTPFFKVKTKQKSNTQHKSLLLLQLQPLNQQQSQQQAPKVLASKYHVKRQTSSTSSTSSTQNRSRQTFPSQDWTSFFQPPKSKCSKPGGLRPAFVIPKLLASNATAGDQPR